MNAVEGSIMGVSNYFNGQPFEVSAVVEQPTNIIIISYDVVELHCDLLTKETLKNYTREYPPDAEVKKMYSQTLKWSQFKKTLFDEKLYQTKRMTRLRNENREVAMKKPELPKDIVAYICNKPKPLFFSKKKMTATKVEIPESSKATETKLKENTLRKDYESSGTQSVWENMEFREPPTARKTLIFSRDSRSRSQSKHLSLN